MATGRQYGGQESSDRGDITITVDKPPTPSSTQRRRQHRPTLSSQPPGDAHESHKLYMDNLKLWDCLALCRSDVSLSAQSAINLIFSLSHTDYLRAFPDSLQSIHARFPDGVVRYSSVEEAEVEDMKLLEENVRLYAAVWVLRDNPGLQADSALAAICRLDQQTFKEKFPFDYESGGVSNLRSGNPVTSHRNNNKSDRTRRKSKEKCATSSPHRDNSSPDRGADRPVDRAGNSPDRRSGSSRMDRKSRSSSEKRNAGLSHKPQSHDSLVPHRRSSSTWGSCRGEADIHNFTSNWTPTSLDTPLWDRNTPDPPMTITHGVKSRLKTTATAHGVTQLAAAAACGGRSYYSGCGSGRGFRGRMGVANACDVNRSGSVGHRSPSAMGRIEGQWVEEEEEVEEHEADSPSWREALEEIERCSAKLGLEVTTTCPPGRGQGRRCRSNSKVRFADTVNDPTNETTRSFLPLQRPSLDDLHINKDRVNINHDIDGDVVECSEGQGTCFRSPRSRKTYRSHSKTDAVHQLNLENGSTRSNENVNVNSNVVSNSNSNGELTKEDISTNDLNFTKNSNDVVDQGFNTSNNSINSYRSKNINSDSNNSNNNSIDSNNKNSTSECADGELDQNSNNAEEARSEEGAIVFGQQQQQQQRQQKHRPSIHGGGGGGGGGGGLSKVSLISEDMNSSTIVPAVTNVIISKIAAIPDSVLHRQHGDLDVADNDVINDVTNGEPAIILTEEAAKPFLGVPFPIKLYPTEAHFIQRQKILQDRYGDGTRTQPFQEFHTKTATSDVACVANLDFPPHQRQTCVMSSRPRSRPTSRSTSVSHDIIKVKAKDHTKQIKCPCAMQNDETLRMSKVTYADDSRTSMSVAGAKVKADKSDPSTEARNGGGGGGGPDLRKPLLPPINHVHPSQRGFTRAKKPSELRKMRILGGKIIGKTIDMKDINPVKEFKLNKNVEVLPPRSTSVNSIHSRASRARSLSNRANSTASVTFSCQGRMDQDCDRRKNEEDKKKEKAAGENEEVTGKLKGCCSRMLHPGRHVLGNIPHTKATSPLRDMLHRKSRDTAWKPDDGYTKSLDKCVDRQAEDYLDRTLSLTDNKDPNASSSPNSRKPSRKNTSVLKNDQNDVKTPISKSKLKIRRQLSGVSVSMSRKNSIRSASSRNKSVSTLSSNASMTSQSPVSRFLGIYRYLAQ